MCPSCGSIMTAESEDGKKVIVCRGCGTTYGTIIHGESGHSIET